MRRFLIEYFKDFAGLGFFGMNIQTGVMAVCICRKSTTAVLY